MKFSKMFLIIGMAIFATNALSQQKQRLSVSGTPQDEAYCGILGFPNTRIPDKKCIGMSMEAHTTIVRTTYAVNYPFTISSTDNQDLCKSIEFAQPLLNYLNINKIAFKETHSAESDAMGIKFNMRVSCNFSFRIDKKEVLCSRDAFNVLKNNVQITKQELTKANNWNQTRTSLSEACK